MSFASAPSPATVAMRTVTLRNRNICKWRLRRILSRARGVTCMLTVKRATTAPRTRNTMTATSSATTGSRNPKTNASWSRNLQGNTSDANRCCSSTRWMACMLVQLARVLTSSWCVGASRCQGGFLPSGAAVALSPLRGAEWVSPTRTDCTSKRKSRSGGRTAVPDSRSSFMARDTGHSMKRIYTQCLSIQFLPHRKHSVSVRTVNAVWWNSHCLF